MPDTRSEPFFVELFGICSLGYCAYSFIWRLFLSDKFILVTLAVFVRTFVEFFVSCMFCQLLSDTFDYLMRLAKYSDQTGWLFGESTLSPPYGAFSVKPEGFDQIQIKFFAVPKEHHFWSAKGNDRIKKTDDRPFPGFQTDHGALVVPVRDKSYFLSLPPIWSWTHFFWVWESTDPALKRHWVSSGGMKYQYVIMCLDPNFRGPSNLEEKVERTLKETLDHAVSMQLKAIAMPLRLMCNPSSECADKDTVVELSLKAINKWAQANKEARLEICLYCPPSFSVEKAHPIARRIFGVDRRAEQIRRAADQDALQRVREELQGILQTVAREKLECEKQQAELQQKHVVVGRELGRLKQQQTVFRREQSVLQRREALVGRRERSVEEAFRTQQSALQRREALVGRRERSVEETFRTNQAALEAALQEDEALFIRRERSVQGREAALLRREQSLQRESRRLRLVGDLQTCSICHDEMKGGDLDLVARIRCGHVFHCDCEQTMSGQGYATGCPLCGDRRQV